MEIACSKSELDVFRPVDVQVALTDGRWLTYYPLNPVSGAQVIEFNIPGAANDVIDMNNISIYVRGKVTKGDGSALGDAAVSGPVNNFLASLFTDVDVAINGQLITRSSREYAYKDYLSRLLFTDNRPGVDGEYQNHCIGWHMDEPENYEKQTNKGLVARQIWIKASREFELQGRPAIDLFDCDRTLHPGQDLHLKFHVSDSAFSLIELTGTDAAKVTITSCELNVRRVTVADSFVNDINQKLASGAEAIYPFVRREFSVISIASGTSTFNKENLFQGKLANRYTIGFVNSDAYTGDKKRNPFLFEDSALTDIGLYVDGQAIGGRPYKIKFDKNDKTIQCYHQLLETIGGVGERAVVPAISHKQFVGGSALFVFTRSPDLCHGENHLIQQSANLTLKAIFGTATKKPLIMLCMAEYDSVLRINHVRNVITDYPV